MIKNRGLKTSLMACITLLQVGSNVFAQKDTTVLPDNMKGKTITITSAYTPVLKDAPKVNFSASDYLLPAPKATLQYTIPSIVTPLDYTSAPLYPLALSIDSSMLWQQKSFLKMGYGNLSTPYIETGIVLGNTPQKYMGIYGFHTQSKGELPFQSFAKSLLSANGVVNLKETNTLKAKLLLENRRHYEYGLGKTVALYDAKDLLRNYFSLGAGVSLENRVPNQWGFDYHPSLDITTFSDNKSSIENTFLLKVPFSKVLNNSWKAQMNTSVDASVLGMKSAQASNNVIVSVEPSVQFQKPAISTTLGFKSTWDRGQFHLLPHLYLATNTYKSFTLYAGWEGYFQKTTYQSLTNTNTWVQVSSTLKNTRFTDGFLGFKGSIKNHITYNVKGAYQQIFNLPIFINDAYDGRTFGVTYDSLVPNFFVHGSLGYTFREDCSIMASFTKNFYGQPSQHKDVYGYVPLSFNTALRWKFWDKLFVAADVYAWDGAIYFNTKHKDPDVLSGAIDANVGADMTVYKNIDLWLKVNNLFNSQYERWYQYPVLGTNVMAGVTIRFNNFKNHSK